MSGQALAFGPGHVELTPEQRTDYLRRLAECAREMTEILDAQTL